MPCKGNYNREYAKKREYINSRMDYWNGGILEWYTDF